MTCDSSILETTGPSFEAKTLAYSSSFLAYGTLEIPGPGCTENVIAGGFHTIDFDDLYYNPITPTTSEKPGCPPIVNPRLSLPADITSVDPAWASCEPLFYGAYDPPSVVKKASGGLAPPTPADSDTTSARPESIQSTSAAAQAAPAPASPAPTNTIENETAASGHPAPGKDILNPLARPPLRSASPAKNEHPPDPTFAINPKPITPLVVTSIHPTQTSASELPKDGNKGAISPNGASQMQIVATNSVSALAKGSDNPEPVFIDPNDGVLIPSPTNIDSGTSKEQGLNGHGNLGMSDLAKPSTRSAVVNPAESAGSDVSESDAPNSTQTSLAGTPTPLIVASQQVQRASNGAFLVAGQTVEPGNEATISGIPISVGSDNLVLGGSIHEISPSSPQSAPPLIISGDTAQIAPDGNLVIASQTLEPGTQTTLSGGVLSVGSQNIVLNGVTNSFPSKVSTPLVINDQTIQSAFSSDFISASQTFPHGTQPTISEAAISINPDNSVSASLPSTTTPTNIQTFPPFLVGFQTIHQAPNGAIVVASQTIPPGSEATISGHILYVGADGEIVLDGTSTQAFLPSVTLVTVALGEDDDLDSLSTTSPPNSTALTTTGEASTLKSAMSTVASGSSSNVATKASSIHTAGASSKRVSGLHMVYCWIVAFVTAVVGIWVFV